MKHNPIEKVVEPYSGSIKQSLEFLHSELCANTEMLHILDSATSPVRLKSQMLATQTETLDEKIQTSEIEEVINSLIKKTKENTKHLANIIDTLRIS